MKFYGKSVAYSLESIIRSIWQLSDTIILERRIVSRVLESLWEQLETVPSQDERDAQKAVFFQLLAAKKELKNIASIKLSLDVRIREQRTYKELPKVLQATPVDDACCKGLRCVIL